MASSGLFNALSLMLVLCLMSLGAYGKEVGSEEPRGGNFALPGSQRPGPLIGFGENIIDQHEIQMYLAPDDFIGSNKHAVDLVSTFIYGITDRLSILLNAPVALSFKQDQNHSSGWEDLLLQIEYAYYAKTTASYSDQATIVSNVTLPTGSSNKQPPTGFGSSSLFLGGTFSRIYTDWFAFISSGVAIPSAHNGTIFGNNFLYQCGIGRNIYAIESQLIIAWLVELDGTYSGKNKINNVVDPNSGGNVVYFTPSIWVSTPHWIFQVGAGPAVIQHLLGNQTKNTYLLVASLGLTI